MPVNAKGGVRAHVLEMLRNSLSPVSGEDMAESLGVSRVAVWKAIRTLVDSGYGISSAAIGYRLDRDTSDGVFPWEFSADESGFKYLTETASTMDHARTEAFAGCDDGLIVLADRQTAGRGTDGKSWQSFDGALFFTMVTRPSVHAAYAHRETLRAQLALSDAIESITRARAVPHWPNDVYLNGGKACGILAETLSVGSAITFLNLGIGVNTTGSTHRDTRARTNDAKAAGGNITDCGASYGAGIAFVESGRQELLKAFRERFRKNGETDDDLLRAWNARCPLVGKSVRYRVGDSRGDEYRIVEAVFAGVDRSGWAIMQEETERRYAPGTITILDKGTRP